MKGLSLKLSVAALIAFVGAIASLSATYAENEQVIGGKNSLVQIDISAQKATVRPCPDGKEIIFEGKVKTKQGDVTLLCDRLIILHVETKGATDPGSQNRSLPKDWQTGGVVKTVTALGNVKITQKDRMAIAGKGVYDHAKRTLTLTEGPPRFWQPGGSGTADRVVLYLDENRFDFLNPRFSIDPGQPTDEKKK
jgi:lipopolysaccharide export system protein LptA